MSGNNVTKWGTEEVESFIKTLPGCEEHAKTFVEEVRQGLHRLEKYLKLEGFLEMFLKIKSALKST